MLLLAGCASTQEDPDAPLACFLVDNTGGGGSAGSVYLVSDSGERTRLGEVPMGRTLRECIRRRAFAPRYSFVIESGMVDRMDPAHRENQPRALSSGYFEVSPWDEVVWDLGARRVTIRRNGARGDAAGTGGGV